MTQTHPELELLELYVSGSLSVGMDIFIKVHLNFCPLCRAEIETFEAIAGELLTSDQALIDGDLSSVDSILEKILKKPKLKNQEEVSKPIKGGVMPTMINNLVGQTSENISWRFRLPGISDYQISKNHGEEISLLKAEPGTKIFQHTHEGEEATLVLSGAMQDGDTVLQAGDVSIVDENYTHNPSIIGDVPCICLIVLSGKLKFTGRFSRALNLLT
jgi:putative transcriptional regulator